MKDGRFLFCEDYKNIDLLQKYCNTREGPYAFVNMSIVVFFILVMKIVQDEYIKCFLFFCYHTLINHIYPFIYC